MRIVQADIADMEILISWRITVLREVFSLPEAVDTEALRSANEDYYKREIPAGGHIAYFAEDEGRRVLGCGGLCIYSEMPSPDNPTGRCAYLMNVYVRPEHRGKGYGKDIVKWLVEQARSRGITKIYLESSECAKAMYQELGFKEMKDYFKL